MSPQPNQDSAEELFLETFDLITWNYTQSMQYIDENREGLRTLITERLGHVPTVKMLGRHIYSKYRNDFNELHKEIVRRRREYALAEFREKRASCSKL